MKYLNVAMVLQQSERHQSKKIQKKTITIENTFSKKYPKHSNKLPFFFDHVSVGEKEDIVQGE